MLTLANPIRLKTPATQAGGKKASEVDELNCLSGDERPLFEDEALYIRHSTSQAS